MSARRSVDRSAMVPYSAAQMYALVQDVASYPEFLPWCTRAEVHLQTDSEMQASIGLGLGALNSVFTTRNQLDPPERMTLELMDGPFRTLNGHWAFTALGDEGCEVALRVDFEFESTVHNVLFGAAFEKVCHDLIDAFVGRARDLYGGGV
ncbi:MAG: type II toxin-antitoxin system RatA family toxin [Gammaproteobacteria bacterium]|nr:type II toxin-antitoxin system RatA family toxin [Gammaproteobacteria bacterium]NND53532.1 type II toxin-antitoxin system RatA family toxin [Gammaproteobacteria bacterium]